MSPAKRPSLTAAPISAALVAFFRAIHAPIDKPLKTHGFARPPAAIPSRIREVRENLGWIPEGRALRLVQRLALGPAENLLPTSFSEGICEESHPPPRALIN